MRYCAEENFIFSEELVSTFLGAVEKFGELVSPSPSGMLLPDMKDLPFYEVVLEKREADENTYLVTGNMKHFPQEPFIVTAKQMMDILSCNLE